jgi:PIN domain nuclease of toxin-antitoxin system
VNYLADTVAIVRYLSQHPKLGRTAAQIFKDTDRGLHRVYLSGITLMEVLYLSEAKRIDVPLSVLIKTIKQSSNYVLAPVDDQVVIAASVIDDVPELHDRIIVGTASFLGVPILTPDATLSASQHIQTLW